MGDVRRLRTIVPPAPDSSACAVAARLQELAADLNGIVMATELSHPFVAHELASMAERMNRLRAMLEVPDAG